MKTSAIRKILVPTDYSPLAKITATAAVNLARKLGAEVFVFHSYGLPIIGAVETIVLTDQLTQRHHQELNQFVSSLQSAFPGVAVHPVLEFGIAADWIPRKAEELDIDLIIMATKGDYDLLSSVFGSIASNIINHVKCPVLIIPSGCHLGAINELIFASDFHITNNAADYMAPLLQLIDEFDPFVHLVHFGKDKPPVNEGRNVEKLKLATILKNTKHSFHYLETQDVEDSLFEFTKRYHGDLIVTVTRHYTLWEQIFHRRLTKEIALHSDTPLLILHEK